MKPHEKAAMEDAFSKHGAWANPETCEAIWNAARAYVEPKQCKARTTSAAWRCVLHEGHSGDHKADYSNECYIGWAR